MALKRVTKSHPCLICGKTSWCSYDDDKVLCSRSTEGADKVAKDGSGIFILALKTKAELRALPYRDSPCPAPAQAQPLDYSLIHAIYSAIVAASPVPPLYPLITDPQKGLVARGFTSYDTFAMLPGRKGDRTRLLHQIFHQLNITHPAGVPGIWHSDVEWRLGSPYDQKDALLIPTRATDGTIRGLQIRYPTKNKDQRYRWLTSAKLHRGTASHAHVHYLWPETSETKVLVTEGALKAEVLHLFYPQHRIVGIPGLSIGLAEFMPLLTPYEMVLCFDKETEGTDAWRNVQKAQQRILTARIQASSQPNWQTNWDNVKGMDDAKIGKQQILLKKA